MALFGIDSYMNVKENVCDTEKNGKITTEEEKNDVEVIVHLVQELHFGRVLQNIETNYKHNYLLLTSKRQ